jgi:hypothetical protein
MVPKFEPTVTGRSPARTRTQNELKVTIRAEAKVTWSLGHGKVSVSFDPTTSSEIAVANGPLTITDPGYLKDAFEKALKDELARARTHPNQTVHTKTTRRIVPRGHPLPKVELNLGTATLHTPLLNVTTTAAVVEDKGKPSVKVSVSTSFTARVAGYGDVKVGYSITADAEPAPKEKKKTRSSAPMPFYIAALAAALLLLGAAARIRTVPNE